MNSQSFLPFILASIKPFKWLIISRFIIGSVWAVDLSLRPYLIKNMLDKVAHSTATNISPLLANPAIFYILMSVLVLFLFRIYDYTWLQLNPNLRKNVGLNLMDKMMDHSHQLYQNQFAGSLVNKINDAISGIPNIIRIFIDRFYSNMLAFLLATYTLYITNIKFAFALIIWSIIFLIGSLKFSTIAGALSKYVSEVRSELVGNEVDILGNISSVRFFVSKKYEHDNLSAAFSKLVDSIQKRDWFFLKLSFFQEASFVIFQAICLWWLIIGLKNQTITAGDFALVLILNGSIISCLWNLAHDIGEFAEELGQIEQGLNIVLSPIDIQDKLSAQQLEVKHGKIAFDKVYFHYKGTKPLFEDLSVTITGGQKVGLVGYSGSGKTTFVNLILRTYDINSGGILIDAQDIQNVTQDSLRQSIGVIPQDPSLFHRSLIENIRYGRLSATDEEVINATKLAHADEFIAQLPLGYQSLVGERGVKLSGGQRQRIAIARVILKNAPILILDEATSQLDSVTEEFIQESLATLMKDKTTVVVAHRLSTLLHMDRILVFDQGKIVEDDSHQELIKKGKFYKSLWAAQIGSFLPKQKSS